MVAPPKTGVVENSTMKTTVKPTEIGIDKNCDFLTDNFL